LYQLFLFAHLWRDETIAHPFLLPPAQTSVLSISSFIIANISLSVEEKRSRLAHFVLSDQEKQDIIIHKQAACLLRKQEQRPCPTGNTPARSSPRLLAHSARSSR